MNPFASFFKRGPDAIQLSDWLENMNESFVEWGFKILSGDKSSQDMLVCFTLINATGSTYNLLHAAPSIASRIGVAYGELRAYFECLWYLYLLTKYESANDRNRISKLYGSVSLKLEQTLTPLFSQESKHQTLPSERIRRAVSKTIRRIREAVFARQ
jgi:hypothetical protein